MKKSSGFLVITLLLFFIADEAYAYLDPGTGSMIVQAVIAGVAALSVSIGIFRRRLLSFLSRFFGQKNSEKDDRDAKCSIKNKFTFLREPLCNSNWEKFHLY